MSEHNERPDGDLLDRAARILRDAPTPAGPDPRLAAATVQLLQASTPSPTPLPLRSRRPLLRLCAAASILIAVAAGLFWLIDRNASFSFAQVVDSVKKAQSVSFVVKQKIGPSPKMYGFDPHREFETKVFIQEDVIRYEIADFLIMVVDTSQRKGIRLEPPRKLASKIDLEGRIPREELVDPIQQLRDLKEDVKDMVEALGEEEIDDRKCRVYQVKNARRAILLPGSHFTLWVDAKSGLPVRILAEDKQSSLLYEQFRWNEPLGKELFTLAIPKGYRLEEPTPTKVRPGRIHYHHGSVEFYSIDPDGKNPESQFVPRMVDTPITYSSGRAELSPDGRYLAIAYSHVTDEGAFPPYRVLLWDRTRPKEKAVEVYAHPDRELQSWQFSPDGGRLYVNWWQGVPGRRGPKGRVGTDVVDLKTLEKDSLKLPQFKDAKGKKQDMRFAAVSRDGRIYLVVGNGLHVATPDGKLVRRLSAGDVPVLVPSVRVSPDGNRVVYATLGGDRSQQLFVASLEEGKPKELVPSGKLTDLSARWSPDGKRIAYTSRLFDPANEPHPYGTETHLKTMDPDGANPIDLITRKVRPTESSLELTAWR